MSIRKLPPPREGLDADMRLMMNVKRGKDLNVFRDRHLLGLWRLSRVLCGDDASAAEVLLAALGGALDASGTWPRDTPLDHWLHQRLLEYWLRREKRTAAPEPVERPRRGRRGGRGGRRSRPARPAPAGSAEPGDGLRFDGDGALQITPANGSLSPEPERIERAARCLPARLRITWALADVCGRDVAETAAILDLSAAAVLSRLHRARLILRGNLPQQPAAEPPRETAS